MSESEHEHGSMDISVQEKTFDGFIKWSTRGAIACIVVLIIMAIFGA